MSPPYFKTHFVLIDFYQKPPVCSTQTWSRHPHEMLNERKKERERRCPTIFAFQVCDLESESHSVMSDSLQPHGLYSPWNSPGQNIGETHCMPFPSPGDLPSPGIKPRSPALQVDSSPAEPPEKPKNTGVGSLSLLQRIFSTQESNRGLLICRWILYQLS